MVFMSILGLLKKNVYTYACSPQTNFSCWVRLNDTVMSTDNSSCICKAPFNNKALYMRNNGIKTKETEDNIKRLKQESRLLVETFFSAAISKVEN